MREERIEAYIHQRLAELDKQKDLKDTIYKGRFSFGVDSTTYGHLPAWPSLLKKKKEMIRAIWLTGFFVTFMIVGMAGNYFDTFDQDWLKTILKFITISAGIMLFYVIGSFYSLFVQFRQTEREIRKLIYQDILFQLKKEEKELV